MYSLTDFLGLKGAKARNFSREIEALEKKISHGGSVSAKITAQIFEKSNAAIRELGFSDGDILAQEAFSALRNKFLGDQILENPDDFWQKNSKTLIVAKNGLISANSKDVEANLAEKSGAKNQIFENFLEEFRTEIAEKYHEKLPQISVENIKKRLF